MKKEKKVKKEKAATKANSDITPLNENISEKQKKFSEEYEYIKKEVLKLDKEEIFERAFFINFYTEVYNFLKYLSEEDIIYYTLDDSSIYNLFEFFMSDDIYSINTSGDIINFLKLYRNRRESNEIR